MSATQAVQLAVDKTSDVNSFAATLNIQGSSKPGSGSSLGNAEIAGTMQEQLHPSLLASADFGTFSVAGQSLPGGMDEVITPKAIYLKLSMLTQALHSAKPWVEMPLSGLSKISGLNLGSLINQAQTSSPLTQTRLLAGATDVRKVGTGAMYGDPVTEYTGVISTSVALAKLPADVRSQLAPVLREAGMNGAKFRAWIDGQHLVRKEILTVDASVFTETVTTTVTSINQPVTISVPTASQTMTWPGSILSNVIG